VQHRERTQNAAASRRQPHVDFATVRLTRHAKHQSFGFHASHQLHRAVVTNLQPLRKIADTDFVTCRHALDGEQKLVLLGLNANQAGSVFAESYKAPDLVAKLGQGAVVSRCQTSVFPQVRQPPYNIVIRYMFSVKMA
jgi:hypothetical protein